MWFPVVALSTVTAWDTVAEAPKVDSEAQLPQVSEDTRETLAKR